MGYLPRLEQLKMQGLDKWWYVTGVGRVQVSLDLQKMFYFTYEAGRSCIMAISETGECRQFDFRGEAELTHVAGSAAKSRKSFVPGVPGIRQI